MVEQVWTVRAALDWTRGYLADKGDEQPRLSAEWLLSAATGLSRIELYAHHDRPLTPAERSLLREGVKRRAAGEPLQYVTGEVAFRHLILKVRPGVLIPRPETEVLAGEVLAAVAAIDEPVVVDLCTGSGCIALAVAQEHPGARVYATDVSPIAVEVARDNAERLALHGRVVIAEGDLFGGVDEALRGGVDAVVSNPPYIPTADLPALPAEVAGFEPHLALDGGVDGLDFWRRIADEARAWLVPGGLLAVELDERCVSQAAEEARLWYQDVMVVRDLAGRDRIVLARRGPNV